MFFPDISLTLLRSDIGLDDPTIEFIQKNKCWILSFSGGGDSVLALFSLLVIHRAKPKPRQLIIFYLDHGIQFSSAAQVKREKIFSCIQKDLKRIKQLNVKWVPIKKDVSKISKRLKWSFEYTGSFLRKKALRTLYKKHKGVIILGHTLSDWYETIIMRINRGSSVERSIPYDILEYSQEKSFFRPLALSLRNEVRQINQKYSIDFWDDPTNKDNSILRNDVRSNFNILNPKGLKKTALNFLLFQKEKMSPSVFIRYGPPVLKTIDTHREIRFDYEKYKNLDQISREGLKMELIRYLGFPSFSAEMRKKVQRDIFSEPPFFMEKENWGGTIYLSFHRGRMLLKETQKRSMEQIQLFVQKFNIRNIHKESNTSQTDMLHLKKNGQNIAARIIHSIDISKKNLIRLKFGHKSVKKMLNEKNISLRQRKNLYLLIDARESLKILFIPLSVFGIQDIFDEQFSE